MNNVIEFAIDLYVMKVTLGFAAAAILGFLSVFVQMVTTTKKKK